MKIVISSKMLANGLPKFDSASAVKSIRLVRGRLYLTPYSGDNFETGEEIDLGDVEAKAPDQTIKQNNIRWDWIEKDIRRLDERPIVMEISESKVLIILDY